MGAIVAVAVAAVAIFALAGGDAATLGGVIGDDPPETPEFAFATTKPKAVETATDPNHQQAVAAARAPADAVTQRIDDLYTAAFLDPGNWMEADYEDVLAFFGPDAAEAAERQLDVLTAGPAAADAFDSIRPMPSTLKVHVLLDPAGAPKAVEGSARFVARGVGADGQVTLVSKGQFVFEKADGEWVVVSFSVRRSDEEPATEPSASASAGPSEAEAS